MDLLKELLKEFGVNTETELFQKKETELQVKAYSTNKPKRVQMTIDECRKLCKDAGLEYLDGYESRVVEHVISDETSDRYGDIVRAAGCDMKNYKKNPVILFAHDHSEFPIGNSVKVWVDKIESNVKSWGLYFDDRIDPTGRSDASFKLISSGAMPACSIGFIPKKANRPTTKEDREKIGLGEYGIEYLQWELLEYSACSVPANPNALLNMVRDKSLVKKDCEALKGLFPDDFVDQLLKEVVEEPELPGSDDIPDEKEFDPALKPYPNEHACRLNNPNKYETCRRSTRKHEGKSYSVVSCKLKGKDKWEEQSYRYNKDTWQEDDARTHCKAHNGILFEPAEKNAEILRTDYLSDEDKAYELIDNVTKEMSKLNDCIKGLTETLEPLLDLKKSANPPSQQGGDNPENKDHESLYKMFEGEVEF